MKANEQFNDSELSYLDSVYNLTPTIYTNSDKRIALRNYAKNTLSWDDAKIFIHLETWLTNVEYIRFKQFLEVPPSNGGGPTSNNNCKCASRFACAFGLGRCQNIIDCTVTTSGCGWVGGDPCTGDCTY